VGSGKLGCGGNSSMGTMVVEFFVDSISISRVGKVISGVDFEFVSFVRVSIPVYVCRPARYL